jgi:hypothetical protein
MDSEGNRQREPSSFAASGSTATLKHRPSPPRWRVRLSCICTVHDRWSYRVTFDDALQRVAAECHGSAVTVDGHGDHRIELEVLQQLLQMAARSRRCALRHGRNWNDRIRTVGCTIASVRWDLWANVSPSGSICGRHCGKGRLADCEEPTAPASPRVCCFHRLRLLHLRL